MDEICNGGPAVGDELRAHFYDCPRPCRVSSYTNSILEKVEMTYMKDEKNEATFVFTISETRPIEKEVLVYDLADMIGAVGGTLGITIGLSIFGIISCCIDNFSELLIMFQNKHA